VRQHGERVGAVLAFQKLLGPAAHRGVGVGIVALDIARQVGRLFGEVGKGKFLRIFLDRGQLRQKAKMFQPNGAVELEPLSRAAELGDGNRIAERIVDPAHMGGGVYRQSGMQQAQIVAVARPEHQAMLAQGHWGRIVVARAMVDLEGAHAPP
jgi:hypothetical protein